MDALGLRPDGFRPPGGRLTTATVGLLRDLGLRHCSPAGRGVGIRDGIVVLPFAWALLDAYRYLPRFAELRERDLGSGDAQSPERFRDALDAALGDVVERGGHLALVFHPFLTEPEERFSVIERQLGAVRRLVDEGVVWCAPHRDVADFVHGDAAVPDALRLDPTVA
jgi:hypothetical protein